MFCFCKFLYLVDLRICFSVKRARFREKFRIIQNSGSTSTNTVWDLSRERWWDLITYEFIFFLCSLIVWLCLKHLLLFSYFETFWCFTKFSFRHKWSDARFFSHKHGTFELPYELPKDLRLIRKVSNFHRMIA